MAKKIDPKAKAKRQKIIAIAGAAILVVLLIVEVPGMLKQLNPPNQNQTPSPAAAATAGAGTPAGTLAPPTLAGSGTGSPATAAVVAPPAGVLAATDPPVTKSQYKLVSFNIFVSKDPFQQQVNASGSTGSTTTGTGTTTTPTTPPPPTPPATPPPPTAAPTSAVISINGVSETVAVGKTFPAAAPVPFFQLVAVTTTSIKVGIAGGSLTNGQNTVTIAVGSSVTLLNTANGTRYTIKAVSVS